MNIFYISTFVACAIALLIIFFKIKKTRQLNELLKERQYTKLSSVNWLIIIHLSLIAVAIFTSFVGYREKNVSMFISSLMIIDLCLFELMNYTFDGTVYYANDFTIIQNQKIKNKHIVRINIRGKIFKSADITLTNGNSFMIGYKAALKLKENLKK